MTDKRKILEVVDGFNGYYLYHNPSGQARGMGDGVDEEFYYPPEDRVVTLEDGEELLLKAWQHHIDEWDYLDYFEAYFHDLYEREIYENGPDVLFVVTGQAPPVKNCPWADASLGLHVWRDGCHWQRGQVQNRELGQPHGHLTLVAYPDLSYDEQQAVAEALEEYEGE